MAIIMPNVAWSNSFKNVLGWKEGRKYVALCCKSLLNYHKHKNYYGEDKGYDKL
jgi:hypothetical protein